MTKEEIIEAIHKISEHGLQNYLAVKFGSSDDKMDYWDGYTDALECLSNEIRGENL